MPSGYAEPPADLSDERHTDNAYGQQDYANTFTAGDFLVEGQEANDKRPENAEHAPLGIGYAEQDIRL